MTQGWISVTERMPEFDVPVLVFDGVSMTTAMWWERKPRPSEWQLCYIGGWAEDSEVDSVTHWMPLPDAPTPGEWPVLEKK
jgi:hypothetical protein